MRRSLLVMTSVSMVLVAGATPSAGVAEEPSSAPHSAVSDQNGWGPADEIGAANRLTPQMALDAAKLVTTGKTYSLGMTVDSKTPAYGHRSFRVIMTQPENPGGKPIGSSKLTYNDEVVEGWLGVGTQLNGLGHIGIDNVYYNGNRTEDFVTVEGVRKLGLEKVPPMVTRGVLLDMAAHRGMDIIPEGTAFSAAEIEAVAKRQKVTIRPGDVVLFNTGWHKLMGKDNTRFLAGGPGINRNAARYLADRGVVAVGSDTWALEVVPFEPGAGTFEVNQFLVAKKGIHVLENVQSAGLAADRVYEFMFTLGHAKYAGTTQSIINPVAIR